MMKQILLLLPITVLVLSFQNCNKEQFTETPQGDLVSKADDQDPAAAPTTTVEDRNDEGSASIPAICESDDPAPSPMPGASATPANGELQNSKPDNSKKNANCPPKSESSSDSGLFACVLGGPGKSLRVAYDVNAGLHGKNGTPDDVCMSENACMKIVSEVFEVKEAVKRGYCQHNPHIHRFSDEQIQKLVDKIKTQIK
jgi:ferredoxin